MENKINIDITKIKTHKQADDVLEALAAKGFQFEVPEGATVKAKVELIGTFNTPSDYSDAPADEGTQVDDEVDAPRITLYKNKLVTFANVRIQHGKKNMEVGFEDGTTDLMLIEDFESNVTYK